MRKTLITSMMVLAATASFAQGAKNLKFNEILVTNTASIVDEYGCRSAWIEFHNDAFASANARNCFLTTDRRVLNEELSAPDRIKMMYQIPSGDVATHIEGKQKTKNFTMGTSHSDSPYFAFDKENTILYVFYNASKSTTVYVDIVNLSNWASASISSTTWTTDTAVGPLAVTGNDNQPFPLPICRGYVYLPISNNASTAEDLLRVKLSSTSNQTEFTGTIKGVTGVFAPDADGRIIAGKCFVINHNALYPTAVGTPDVINNPTSANFRETTILDQGEGLVQMARLKGQGYGYYYPSVSKFYLASKFNLPEEVTKSNVQSMVITYTLTEV